MKTQIHERREARVPVEMSGQCRVRIGRWDWIRIDNLSAAGCALASGGSLLHERTRVVVRFGGLEGLPGTVRWISRAKAGIEFDRPLYPPVLDHLARNNAVHG